MDFNQFAISQYKINADNHCTKGDYDNIERCYNYPDDKTRRLLIESGVYEMNINLILVEIV